MTSKKTLCAAYIPIADCCMREWGLERNQFSKHYLAACLSPRGNELADWLVNCTGRRIIIRSVELMDGPMPAWVYMHGSGHEERIINSTPPSLQLSITNEWAHDRLKKSVHIWISSYYRVQTLILPHKMNLTPSWRMNIVTAAGQRLSPNSNSTIRVYQLLREKMKDDEDDEVYRLGCSSTNRWPIPWQFQTKTLFPARTFHQWNS
jgi:hypothetical protein